MLDSSDHFGVSRENLIFLVVQDLIHLTRFLPDHSHIEPLNGSGWQRLNKQPILPKSLSGCQVGERINLRIFFMGNLKYMESGETMN